MARLFATTFLLLAAGLTSQLQAFSLLGPFAVDANGQVWQVTRIGYNQPGDIGGPMNAAAGEEYRWNTPNIFYAYDDSFLAFFGMRGVEEVEKAIKILNDLPPASVLDVNAYPMTAERVNYRAAALGISDLKSWTLSTILEQIGLTCPSRWVFCLRNRYQPGPDRFPVFFTVIRRNFDPITAAESPYINGRLWTYTAITDPDDVPPGSQVINSVVDPLDFGRFDPVAAVQQGFTGFSPGSYFTGLTRDDVGGIKFIYQAANWNFESVVPGGGPPGGLIPSTGGSVGGSPWDAPPGLTNILGTNAVVLTNLLSTNLAFNPVLRFGVNKLNFRRAQYDSLVGRFLVPITNVFTEFVVTNGVVFRQVVQRTITVPDFLFTCADLNDVAEPGGIPVGTLARTVTTGWVNSDSLLGGQLGRSGPGVITPPVAITYNNVGFITVDRVPGVRGPNVLPWHVWGAFDGTTNEPVVFSKGGNITLQELEALRLRR